MTGQPALAQHSTDRELLQCFVAARDERAFAALVLRHGACVLGVSRRVLGNDHDAEDVFQATFLTLARKAAVIAWQESVGHWLRAVALRLALQARGAAERRRGREGPGPGDELPEPCDPQGDPLVEVARRELRLVIDEELRRLPEKYRVPVVLCYLEGKTNEQAAGEMGWPTGSMSRRLARARALLHERLARRGLAFGVALCGLALVAFWLLRGPGPRPLAAHGAEEAPSALLRLAADGNRPTQEPRGRLVRLARRTARLAEALHDQGPGRHRPEWRRLSGEMRRSALDLAEALAHHDERSTRAATRRLAATCQNCHASFRD